MVYLVCLLIVDTTNSIFVLLLIIKRALYRDIGPSARVSYDMFGDFTPCNYFSF
jgi:hypothetical protein